MQHHHVIIYLHVQERGRKQLGRRAALSHLAGLALVCALGGATLAAAQGRGALIVRLAFSTFGLVYALVATKVSVLSHSDIPPSCSAPALRRHAPLSTPSNLPVHTIPHLLRCLPHSSSSLICVKSRYMPRCSPLYCWQRGLYR